jgi:ABC-type phosphonate transport system ATPase subunit
VAWRVEERVACPDVIDVLQAKARMLEQVRGLRVDLEGVLVVEDIRIKALTAHRASVLQTNTTWSLMLAARAMRRGCVLRLS